MNFTLNDNGTVSINMREYIQEAIDVFGEDVSTPVKSIAPNDLFEIDETSKPLNDEKQDRFHSVVAKLLWVMKRGRPDLETSVSFLCTRVSCSTEQDWIKLKRALRFLNCTIRDERIIGIDDITKLHTYIDASYAVHNNMRSHTGGLMTLGVGYYTVNYQNKN